MNKKKSNKSVQKKIITILIMIVCVIGLCGIIFKIGETVLHAGRVNVAVEDFNFKREEILKEHLEPVNNEISQDEPTENTSELNTESFTIQVTPVSDNKSVVHIKNNTDFFYTGNIIINKKITIAINSLAPHHSENVEVARGISSDIEYSYDGELYKLKKTPSLPFSLSEEYLGNDQFKILLSVESLDENAEKQIAQYYYILDTLYNFSSATEYLLYNEDASEFFGTWNVDPVEQTSSFYQNDKLIFSEKY